MTRTIFTVCLVAALGIFGVAFAQDSAPAPAEAAVAAPAPETAQPAEAAVAAPAPETAQPAEAKPAEPAEEKAEDSAEESDDSMPETPTVPPDAGVLRYGGDLEGGAPYVFQDPKNPDKLIGFEVDILEVIAARMGRRLQFVQNDWDKLIPGLTRNLYDLAMQGQEITEEHEEAVSFTVPYYITSLQLSTRKDYFDISTLQDCKGHAIGTLKESEAFYLLEELGEVDIRSYQTEVNGYDDLVNGRLEATLFDGPVSVYYGLPRPELRFVGDPIGRVAYGFAITKDNTEIISQVNKALLEMRENGQLRRILERWNLWNPLMANELRDFGAKLEEPVMYDQWVKQMEPPAGWKARVDRYVSFLPIFGKAAIVTMEISILSMLLAILVGFLLAMARVYAPAPFSTLAVIYIEIVRGTPLLIQLFFIFYGLPSLGIKLSPFVAGVVGLGMNYAAYEAENYRAGFSSVPRSQMEAALGLAMSKWQAIRHIIAPQAFRVVLPPVTNDFISLLKDSSLVSVITMVELTKVYGQLATTYYDYFGTGIMVAVIYLLLGLPFVRLARMLEKRMTVDKRHIGRIGH
jgi:polar amino acid transport system substrate-binding protein